MRDGRFFIRQDEQGNIAITNMVGEQVELALNAQEALVLAQCIYGVRCFKCGELIDGYPGMSSRPKHTCRPFRLARGILPAD